MLRELRLRHLPVVATLLAAAWACASVPGGMAAQGPEGCYFFDPGETVEALRLPRGVQLTDRALEGWPAIMQRGDVKVAVTLTRSGTAAHPFGYWLAEGDSLEIGYPSGGGIVLDVALQDGALEGTARTVGDVIRPGQEPETVSLPVRLTRGSCP